MTFTKGKSGNPGGRPKGAKGKVTQAMRELYRQALDELGGVEYLKKLGRKHPQVFAAGLQRMIPDKQEHEHGGELVFRHPDLVARGREAAMKTVTAREKRAARGAK